MSKKLFVGGLAWATTDERLKEVFAPYGSVIDAKVICDRETGRSRGFGFVGFNTEDEAQNAMNAMQGQSVDGRNLRINKAEDKPGPRSERPGPRSERPGPRSERPSPRSERNEWNKTSFHKHEDEHAIHANADNKEDTDFYSDDGDEDYPYAFEQESANPPPFLQDSDFGFSKNEGQRNSGRERKRLKRKKSRDRYKDDDSW